MNGGVWGIPDLGPVKYLLELLFEVGPVGAGGFGVMALPWVEIKAFADATGSITEPWEFRAISQMSRAYVTGLREGENPLCIPPAERD